MKVLLVNPNRMKPAVAPIGLDYLADSLLAAGHEPELSDLCFADEPAQALTQAVAAARPDVIGLTIRNTDDCYYSSQNFFLPEIAELVALLHRISAAPVVLGGVGFSTNPEAVLAYCKADFGIAGEGEEAFPELLNALSKAHDFSTVPNLLYRRDGRLRHNPVRFANLDRLPPRRRAFIDNRRYFAEGGQAGFETRRGCPMNCIYCADPLAKGRSIRLVPPNQVVRELTALVDQGIDHFHTCDCEFNLPPKHAIAVCESIIQAGLAERIRWYAYCTPAPFDHDMARLFKRAGCAGINFGVDSGCDSILRRLGRHYTTADLEHTAAVCSVNQIPVMFDLLLGGPGETRDTARQTIGVMRRLPLDCVGLSIGMRVYSGTALAGQLQAEGDPALNHNLYGLKAGNPNFLAPIFYIAPELGPGIITYVRSLVGGDRRFFLPEETSENANYNYNANDTLVEAIRHGARGAYWDILRRVGSG